MYTQAELAALDEPGYRKAYLSDQVRLYVAVQIRAMRESLGLNQKTFAKLVGKPQSVISRLENTDKGQVTVQTLLDIAQALDVALVVKFSAFPEFLDVYSDLSLKRLSVDNYEQTKANRNNISMSSYNGSGYISNYETVAISYGETKYIPTQFGYAAGNQITVGIAVKTFVAMLPSPSSSVR